MDYDHSTILAWVRANKASCDRVSAILALYPGAPPPDALTLDATLYMLQRREAEAHDALPPTCKAAIKRPGAQ